MIESFPINYCLNSDSLFEDNHFKFNKEKNLLLLSFEEIVELIIQCKEEGDNVGISFPADTLNKWNTLEVHGVNGSEYNIEFQISSYGGSFVKKSVRIHYLKKLIKDLPINVNNLIESKSFYFKQW